MAKSRSTRLQPPTVRGLGLALTGVLLAGCGATGSPQSGPETPDAEMHPELLEVSPSPLKPGQTFTVRFPEGTERGLGWTLEEQRADTWHVRYYLSSGLGDSEGDRAPSWWSAADREGGWDALGLAGEGPDLLVVPGSATPGQYRLCTANAAKDFCTTVELTE